MLRQPNGGYTIEPNVLPLDGLAGPGLRGCSKRKRLEDGSRSEVSVTKTTEVTRRTIVGPTTESMELRAVIVGLGDHLYLLRVDSKVIPQLSETRNLSRQISDYRLKSPQVAGGRLLS